jgi:hypothetical protein
VRGEDREEMNISCVPGIVSMLQMKKLRLREVSGLLR